MVAEFWHVIAVWANSCSEASEAFLEAAICNAPALRLQGLSKCGSVKGRIAPRCPSEDSEKKTVHEVEHPIDKHMKLAASVGAGANMQLNRRTCTLDSQLLPRCPL